MTLLESARGAIAYAPEQMDDKAVQDGQQLNSKLHASAREAFLPFDNFALARGEDINSRNLLGVEKTWSYSRKDSVMNPDGGRCDASSTSMRCGGDGARQYKGKNGDAPQLYANQETVNGKPLTRQYFQPANDVPSVSPEAHRYLNPGAASENVHTREVANRFERFEDSLEKPIAWRSNSLEAFVEAIENEKPMVVVFGDDSSPMFNKQIAELQADKENKMGRLSDRAVFVVGKPNHDEYARRMASHLKLTDYPTISVIAPRTDQLTETYRMEGYFDVATIFSDLNAALPQAKPKTRPNTVVA